MEAVELLNSGGSAKNVYSTLFKVKRFKDILIEFINKGSKVGQDLPSGENSVANEDFMLLEKRNEKYEDSSVLGKRKTPEKVEAAIKSNNKDIASFFQPRRSTGKQVVKD